MTSVSNFYTDRTVLVTGGTGFMGKVLLEKMVRSLPNIKTIYLLVREKKGLTPEQRIDSLISKVPFTFNNIDPNNLKKLVAVHADVTKENLGLTSKDRQKLIDEVSVVFHLAASIRMNLSLKDALVQNTFSTQKVLDLCTEMKNLVSVVHLSTAYCNVDIEFMEEKVYPTKVDPYKIMDMVKWMDDESLEKVEKSIIKPHPNSYTFTKRLAEIVAWDMGKKLPLAIARPSIVIPSLSEPTPGWVDTINGPVGIIAAAGKGVLRTMMADMTIYPQVAPVDLAINSLIILGCLRATEKFTETPVYNLTQGDVLNVSWQEALDKIRAMGQKYPFHQMLWYPGGAATTIPIVHKTRLILFHMIPAYIIDFLLILCLQKPFMVDIHKRLNQGLEVLSYFVLKKFVFTNTNTLKLDQQLDAKDAQTFVVSQAKYDIDDYFWKAFFGAKRFCFNETHENVYANKIRITFFYLLDRGVKFLIAYGLAWLILNQFEATHLLSWSYWLGAQG